MIDIVKRMINHGIIFLSVITAIYVYYNTGILKFSIVSALGILLLKPLLFFVSFRIRRLRYLHSSISKVDRMDGHEFEEYLKVHFCKLGYKCRNVGKNGHDYGVDLIIYKKGICTAVQAKRYKGNVGIKAIQEVMSGMKYYDCDAALVVTNSYFTRSAEQLAEKCNIELWNREECKKNFKMK